MKFINRKKERMFIEECKKLSKSKLFSLCIFGLRRVGKTRLILESLEENDLYFFVNKYKQSESLLKEYEDALRSRKILTELESLKSWDDFFRVVFERYKGVIVFDEFQNFSQVDKAVFGVLQKRIDLNENKKGILIIFSGSTIGLIRTIFFDRKEPLYDRLKRRMQLKPLSFSNIIKICNELNIKNIEEVIALYAIFGGFPKYYVAIEDENLNGKQLDEIFEKFFFMENAVFEDEVNTILSLEFGKRRGVYYDILAAIANGSTRISEIASVLGKKETALTRQINELVNYFNIVEIKKQVCGEKRLMFIEHPLMNFWFRFFYKDLSRYKRREKSLVEKIKENINPYVGKRFENVCREVLLHSKIIPLEITIIGNQWGKFKGEKGKNTYEIDIVALNEKEKKILFCECKWQDDVDAEEILSKLKEKSNYVDWNNGKRKEYFAIFAKSFKKKIKEEDLFLFDLRDMEKIFKQH